MKKIIIIGLIMTLLIIPSTIAVWWNPFTWFSNEEEQENPLTIYEDISNELYHFNTLSGERVEIKNDEGIPSFTLFKWGNETSLSATIVPVNGETEFELEVEENKLKWKGKWKSDEEGAEEETEIEVEIEPIDIGEDGGLELWIILNEKPKTNVFSFPIDSVNLSYWYQPPLYSSYGLTEPNATCNATDCQGSHRSENVVGSYAVYYNKRDNKYKTGKVLHIYRIRVCDNEGNCIWGDLNIENGVMTITVNQTWLDNAVYPIVIDPSFGVTSVGRTEFYQTQDFMGSDGTPSSSGTIDSCSAYLWTLYNNDYYSYGVYKDSDSSLVGYTDQTNDNVDDAWKLLDIASGGSITGSTKYWILLWAENAIGFYNDDATDRGRTASGAYDYPNFPSSLTLETDWIGDRRFSIYCNYTVVAGDTCDCSSIQGGTAVDCSENCDIENCDVGGVGITFAGAGVVSIIGNVTNTGWKNFTPSGCKVVIMEGQKLG